MIVTNWFLFLLLCYGCSFAGSLSVLAFYLAYKVYSDRKEEKERRNEFVDALMRVDGAAHG